MKRVYKSISIILLSLIFTGVLFAQTTATEWYNKVKQLYDDEKLTDKLLVKINAM